MSLLHKCVEKIRLWLWRNRQFDNEGLREYFRRHYRIDVGTYSYGCFDPWRMQGPMQIGRYCSIARTVQHVPANHPTEALTTHPALYESKFGVVDADMCDGEPLIIEDDVWIGHHTIILPQCRFIGRGAVIGAGSILTRDVQPYTIVAGNPARKLKARFPADLVAEIEESRWWEKSTEELREMLERSPEAVMNPTAECLHRLRMGPAPQSTELAQSRMGKKAFA